MEFKEQIQRILENVPKVYEAGRSSIKNEVANALKGSASGKAVALKDVSPLEHILGVRVESKNKIPYPYYDTAKTENGVTFTDNGDGSITIDGTSTATVNYMFTNINKLFLPAGTYSMSNGNPEAKGYMLIGLQNSEWTDQKTGNISFDKTIYGTLGYCIYQIPKGNTFDNVTIYPQLEYGTKATPWRPYVADTSGVKLLVQGANLLSLDKIIDLSNCSIENGVVTQTEADASPIPYLKAVATLDSGEYELMGKSEAVTASGKVSFQITCAQEINKLAFGFNGSVMDTMVRFDNLSLPAGTYIASCNVINATQGSISWKDMQIALIDTDYEPYKEPIEYAQGEDIKSIAPCTTIMTDTAGTVLTVEYNIDLNEAFAKLYQAIISLGGNV